MKGRREWARRLGALARPRSDVPRVQRLVAADGRVTFLKRFDVEPPGKAMRLHAGLSGLLPNGPWRSSPLLHGAALASRERRKRRAFQTAGQGVPRVVFECDTAIETADCGASIEMRLRALAKAGERRAHEALLVLAAEALGRLHAAELCHGRPHPRDMALREGAIVWFDLEEEPEAVMSLVEAQARDLWLLFHQICGRALEPRTPAAALEAYRRTAGPRALEALAQPIALLRPVLPVLRFAARVHEGADLKRLLLACAFLDMALGGASGGLIDVVPFDAGQG